MNTKFAVILPTIGRESLHQAFNSVLNQSFQDWHLYIIGDGFLPLLKSNLKCTVDMISGPNKDSGTKARNYAISLGKEEWITFIDDDDNYLSHHLQTFANMISQNPHTNMLRTAGQAFRLKHIHPRSSKLRKKLGEINTTDILMVGTAYKRDLFEKIRGFQPCDNHDHILWKEALQLGGIAEVSNIVTFLYER